MIAYTEKGYYLHDEINKQGHQLAKKNGQWVSSDDAAVQLIIDSYDPLPDAKKDAISRVKKEGSRLVAEIYPFIDPESEDAVGLYMFAQDLWQGGQLPARLKAFKGIFDAASMAIADINLLTDWRAVDAYDAVNTPRWP